MKTLQQRYAQVLDRIHDAAVKCGRQPEEIRLLAVSKTHPVEDIIALSKIGQTCFGENYLQEAVAKISATRQHPIEWHFIGPVQSNKTREIAENFDWVHSIDRLKIAQRLNDQRSDSHPPLNICIQVNVSGEASKSGITAKEAEDLCHTVRTLPRLQLRGLMALPAATTDFTLQREQFRRVRALRDTLQASGLSLDCLSMGMSGDLEAAIAEGATLVRIGTDIFGPRHSAPASL